MTTPPYTPTPEEIQLVLDNPKRAAILLRAAHDILERDGNAKETMAFYDDANCDGWCLAADIRIFLGLPEDTEPVTIKSE